MFTQLNSCQSGIGHLEKPNFIDNPKPIHEQIIDIVGGEDRFREIANLKPKHCYEIIIPKEEPKQTVEQYEQQGLEKYAYEFQQETLKKVEENIDREEWIHFFKNNSKEEILEYLIKYKFPL